MGISTHGTKLLVGYLKKLKAGGYRPAASPSMLREGIAWGVIDGDHGLGQVGCRHALQVASNKARVAGMAQVHLIRTGHLGAPGYFAALAAREGFIAMILGNDIPSVAAPGACRAVLGSNPMAYAIPRIDSDPILLDIATAAVAGGKVYAAGQRGEAIPEHWLIGPDGQPTRDGTLYPQSASLAPMADSDWDFGAKSSLAYCQAAISLGRSEAGFLIPPSSHLPTMLRSCSWTCRPSPIVSSSIDV
jgi:LDH2 family malate/lactate/ureidoglycolate dehydrogenase